MDNPATEFKQYLCYEDLFNTVEIGGLIIPNSCLDNIGYIDRLITDLIDDYSLVNPICFSSFLNMIIQTHEIEEVQNLVNKMLREVGLTIKSNNIGILFHRDNLLYFISKIIKKSKIGTKIVTGKENTRNAKDFLISLSLINSKLNKIAKNISAKKHYILKDFFIREYPGYYNLNHSFNLYSHRLERYWYILNNLINEVDNQEDILDGIRIIEDNFNISMKDYFHVAKMVLMWFLQYPIVKRMEKNGNMNLGLNYNHPNSFYIHKQNFKNYPEFIQLIDYLSIDIEGIKRKFNIIRKDNIHGFYKHYQNFFDKPVFKIDEDRYCILDLKFFIEGICSGLIWHLNNLLDINLVETKTQYGYLIEKYFVFLMRNIFRNIFLSNRENGKPDAVLESDNYIIIFEFTTEFFRYASLYNTETSSFLDDLYRILFNEGKDDKRSRGKKDKGKFLKLEKYISQTDVGSKKIIPVLVTENFIGDYNLLDRFDGFIQNNINNKQLINLKRYKPIIINLDALEIFWAFRNIDKSDEEFVESVESWEKSEKNLFHYNFADYIGRKNKGNKENEDYREFFNFINFLED